MSINWNEVSEARHVAEQLKNHYRFADRLVQLINTLDRAKYLMEEAEKGQRAAEAAARAATDRLAKVNADMDEAVKVADAKRAKIESDLAAAEKQASALRQEGQNQLATLQSDTKSAQLALKNALDAIETQGATRRAAIEAAHATRVQAMNTEIADLTRQRDEAAEKVKALRSQLQNLAAGLAR